MRVTVCLTHPVQYFAPWFRYIAAERRELELTVIYAAQPTPAQQGTGFGTALSWDIPLTSGYRHVVLGAAVPGQRFDSDAFFGVNGDGIARAIHDSRPDAVVVPGWHSAFYLRAAHVCRRSGIPVVYRGDTHLAAGGPWWRRPIWRLKTRAMLNRFDGYMAVGTRAHEYLRSFGIPEPLIARSPHAIDNAAFANVAAEVSGDARRAARVAAGLQPDAFVVAFVGKFQPNKRPDTVIRAVHQMSGVSVLMVGAGAQLDSCRALANRLGVPTVWTGLVNQSRIARTLALADCLVLPSEHESWGLAVNEAMACGVPCLVSETAGCAPDLIVPGNTGETFRPGDVADLAAAIDRIRARSADGHDFASACRARVAEHSYAHAADGLVAACRRVVHQRSLARSGNPGRPRVLAAFGGMVLPSGVERMSFEVLRVLRQQGAAAHCVVNTWDSSRIVTLAEQVCASWSTGYYWHRFDRHTRNPVRWLQLAWDIACTSAGLLRDAWRFGATHVLVPEFGTVLRNAPALWLLRRLGVRVILRLGNAPDEGAFYRRLWRLAIDPAVDQYVSNSRFIQGELLAHGIDPMKAQVVHNAAPLRPRYHSLAAPVRDESRVIFVGQIIPQKGLDLLLEAVARLSGDGHDVRLDVVGDLNGWESPSYDGYRAQIRSRAAAADLVGRVRLLGHREDVPALLAAAAVHCCPSRPEQREGFAVVNLEAKRAGTPSVVFPTGSLPEMVTHGVDGWICREPSVEALVEGLGYFLRDSAARRAAGEAARQSDRRYNQARFSAEWGEVFGVEAGQHGSEAIA